MIDANDTSKLNLWGVRFRRLVRDTLYINANTRERAIDALHEWLHENGYTVADVDYIDPPMLPEPRHGEVYTNWLKRNARTRGRRSINA